MIRSLYRNQEGQISTDLKPDEFTAALQDLNGTLYIDFVSEPSDVCEPILRETFNFHPLAVDDALKESHTPKVDDWEDYLYIVLHAIAVDKQDSGEVDTLELDVFLGKNYIITYHARPIPIVDRVWNYASHTDWLVSMDTATHVDVAKSLDNEKTGPVCF